MCTFFFFSLITKFIYRALSDRDADGKLDINEFTIAMHLIELKIKGFDIPKTLPTAMVMPAAAIIPGMPAFRPPVALAGNFSLTSTIAS